MSRDNINFAYNLYNVDENSNIENNNNEISTNDLVLFQTMVTNLLLERTNFPLDEPKKYKNVISKTAKTQLKKIKVVLFFYIYLIRIQLLPKVVWLLKRKI